MLGLFLLTALILPAQELAPKLAVNSQPTVQLEVGFLSGSSTDWIVVNLDENELSEYNLTSNQPFRSLGAHLGLDIRLWIKSKVGIRLQPLLSLTTQRYTLEGSRDSQKVISNRNFVETPIHFLYRFKEQGASFYFFGGPRFRYDVAGNQSSLYIPLRRENFTVDAGFGYKIPIGRINLSPEFTFSGGIQNQIKPFVVLTADPQSTAHLHRFMFSLVFN